MEHITKIRQRIFDILCRGTVEYIRCGYAFKKQFAFSLTLIPRRNHIRADIIRPICIQSPLQMATPLASLSGFYAKATHHHLAAPQIKWTMTERVRQQCCRRGISEPAFYEKGRRPILFQNVIGVAYKATLTSPVYRSSLKQGGSLGKNLSLAERANKQNGRTQLSQNAAVSKCNGHL